MEQVRSTFEEMMNREVREKFSRNEKERENKRIARKNKREELQRKNRVENDDQSWIEKYRKGKRVEKSENDREKERYREGGSNDEMRTPQIKRKIVSFCMQFT